MIPKTKHPVSLSLQRWCLSPQSHSAHCGSSERSPVPSLNRLQPALFSSAIAAVRQRAHEQNHGAVIERELFPEHLLKLHDRQHPNKEKYFFSL